MQIIRSRLKKFPSLFIQGFFALLPVIVTVYSAIVIFGFFNNIGDIIISLLPDFLTRNVIIIFLLKIFLIAFFVCFLAFFGLLVRSIIGKGLLKMAKSFFGLIPGLNVVYKATEQVVAVLTSEKKSFFRKPVLVEYPSPGIWAIAFNTGEVRIAKANGDLKRYTIFIPTTPNPTSGFLAVLTEDKIRDLDMSAEDAIKLILTGGIVKHASIDL